MAQADVHNGGSEKAEVEVSFSAVKPYLVVEAPKASEAVQFYKTAFGAVEIGRTTHAKRKAEQELPQIISAQLELAGSIILVSDITVDSAPVKGVGALLSLCLETKDVDAAVSRAVTAGAVLKGEITESDGSCCSGRVGKVTDPYGFVWLISSPAGKCGTDNVEA